MLFDVAAARLSALPDPLPEPAAVMMPVVIGESVRLPATPRAGRTGRPAAVLVLLYPDSDGEARVVLIERTTGDGHHSGEVSFPGGKAEPDDADAAATALREATEETGLDLDTAGVTVVGALDPVFIPVSDFRIDPIVAVAERAPVLRPNPSEVARILTPPVSAFLPDADVEIVERTIRDWPLRYGGYRIDGLHVWGATARILGQLGAVLGEAANTDLL